MSDVVNPYQTPDSELPEPASGSLYTYQEPRQGVVYALLANLVLSVCYIAALLYQNGILHAMSSGEVDMQQAEQSDEIVMAVSWLGTLTYISCVVLWGMWTVRAARNVRVLEPDATFVFTPGWAVGYFFIPFLNLYKPYQAVREIDIHSGELALDGPAAGASIIGAWWAAWIINNIVAQIAWRVSMQSSDTYDGLATANNANIGVEVLTMIATVLAVMMIRGINRKQVAKRASMTRFAVDNH